MGTIASEYDAASFVRAESRTAGSSVALVLYRSTSRHRGGFYVQLMSVRPNQEDDKKVIPLQARCGPKGG